MNQKKYDFQWFEQEDKRKALRASVGRDGKIRFGKTLRQQLPGRIRIGFDPQAKVLAIADGHGSGIDWPKCGTLTARALSAKISSTGLRLPVSFSLTWSENTGYFLGRIIPRRQNVSGGAAQYDMDQLQVLYQHILDGAVHQLGRSTPLRERRACAMEAFCSAAQSYRPGYGDLEVYLEEQVRRRILTENRQYTDAYRNRSLDLPLRSEDGTSFCLHDTLSVSTSGGIAEADERMMLEQFLDTLPSREKDLLLLVREGTPIPQIASKLSLAQADILPLAREIGRKRRLFYEEI